MDNIPSFIKRFVLAGMLLFVAVLGQIVTGGEPAAAQTAVDRGWGVGWDDGLTVRRWLGGRWELALSAGPDDYLVKDEVRSWNIDDPGSLQGMLEVPLDHREEHGWVRFQAGRLIAGKRDLSLVGYAGVVYEWVDHQERSLQLDQMIGEYDTFELDRFTDTWVLAMGLRPSWQPAGYLTIEMSFGLNFAWSSWDQTSLRTYAGIEGTDRETRSGHGRTFQDFGWQGMGSLQFIFWL